jgi:hypothetical protein
MSQKMLSHAEAPLKELLARQQALVLQHAGVVSTAAELRVFLTALFQGTPAALPPQQQHGAGDQAFASLVAAIQQFDTSRVQPPGYFVQHVLPQMACEAMRFEAVFPILRQLPRPSATMPAPSSGNGLPPAVAEAAPQPVSSACISRRHCFAILSAAFLCAFPRPNRADPRSGVTLPGLNYHRMFHCPPNFSEAQKLVMHFDFFAAIASQLRQLNGAPDPSLDDPSQGLIVARVVVPLSCMTKRAFACPLLPPVVHRLREGIDEQHALPRVDFANKFIGGGSLSQGCVQEEITFSIHPELNVSRYLCEVMGDHEAMLLLNAREYSSIVPGTYARTTRHRVAVDPARTPVPNVIIAIDAVHFQRDDTWQFTTDGMLREVHKALAGFQPVPGSLVALAPQLTAHPSLLDSIATGNWGCGAFNGDVELKALLQWVAASVCGRTMHYFPFDNTRVASVFPRLAAALVEKRVTAGELFRCLGDNAVLHVQSRPAGRGSGLFDLVIEAFALTLVGENKSDC